MAYRDLRISWGRVLRSAAAWALLIAPGGGGEAVAQVVEAGPPLWEATYGFTTPNEGLCGDFNLDGELELLLSDQAGRVVLVEASTGRTLWRQNLGGARLLDPLAGQFVKPAPLELLFLHQDGQVEVLVAASGEAVLRAPMAIPVSTGLSPRFSLAPSLLPATRPQGLDRVVAVRDDRRLVRLAFPSADSVQDAWSDQPGGALGDMPLSPPAVSRFPAWSESGTTLTWGGVFATRGRQLYYSDLEDSSRSPVASSVRTGEDFQVLLAVPETAAGDAGDIYLVDALGNLRAFLVEPGAAGGLLKPQGEDFARTGCVPHRGIQPVLADYNGDGTQDLILTGPSRVVAVDGKARAIPGVGNGYTVVGRFATAPAFFHSGRRPVLVIGDEQGFLHFLDLLQSDDKMLLQRVQVPGLASACPIVLDATGDRTAAVLVHKRGGAKLLRTGLPLAGGPVGWPGAGGGRMRTGGRSPVLESGMAVRVQEQSARQVLEVARARALLAGGDSAGARDSARLALRSNPLHGEALSILRRAQWGIYRFHILAAALAVLAAGVGAGYGLYRQLSIRSLLRRTAELGDAGRGEAVLPLFLRYFRRHSGPASVVLQMASLCRRFQLLPVGLVEILEKCALQHPSNEDVLLVLARLYLREDRLTAGAAAVYELARGLARNPGPFEAALGRIAQKAGRFEEARGHLESAYRQGAREPELYEALARVYVELDQLTPRHIPVFEVVARRNEDQVWILAALSKAYIHAGLQQDPKAQEAFRRLVRIDPRSAIAHQELAAAHYRAVEFAQAREEAQQALESEAENAVALQVLGWCLWRECDLSEEARVVYFRASERHPNDTLLLRAVAQVLLGLPVYEDHPWELRAPVSGGPPSATAAERVVQAMQANPADRDLHLLAAEAGSRWGRREITRLGLESLKSLGELSDAQVLELARIYVAEQVSDPCLAGDLFRAFLLEPGMPGLAERLGEILLAEGIHDARYLDLFTCLFRQSAGVAGLKWGVELARIQGVQQQYDAMSETLHRVQAGLDEESAAGRAAGLEAMRTEVQRLLAVASSNLQDFQQAIAHYQSLLAERADDSEALVGLGRTYARMDRRTEEMRAAIQRAHELAPGDALLNFACGRTSANHEKWSEAAAYFQTALKAGGEYPDLVLNHIDLMIRRNQGAGSIPARWLRVQALLFLRRFDLVYEEAEAIYAFNPREGIRLQAVYDRILQADPKNPTALYARGLMLHRDGRDADARVVLEGLLKIEREHAPARRLLLDVYDQLLKKQDQVALRFALGQLAMQQGDLDRAVSCFQRTRLDPNYEKLSARHLAECFFRKRMYELSLQEFQGVVVDQTAMPLLYQMGVEFQNQGNLMAARMAYQRIYAVDAGYRDVADRLNNITQSSDAALRTLGVPGPGGGKPLSASDKNQVLEVLGGDARQRYDLREELGRGAMATVYKAYDNELDEIVALKVLPDSYMNNPEAVRRFRLEARSARKLSHEHIVRIHDIGEEQGRKYISMEYIAGQTLKKIIQSSDQRITLDLFLRFARQIAQGMAYAHGAGIIHRDLKPANIMIALDETGALGSGTVKITDFGIAKVADTSNQTITGAVVGTPLYMSPEQVVGGECDQRADIYSFGVLLYEMAVGHPPFHEGDLAYHHLHTRPDPIPDLAPALSVLIMRCLEKDREKRFGRFDEILEVLERVPPPAPDDGVSV